MSETHWVVLVPAAILWIVLVYLRIARTESDLKQYASQHERLLAALEEARQAARVGEELEALLGLCVWVSIEHDREGYGVRTLLPGAKWYGTQHASSLVDALVVTHLSLQVAQSGIVEDTDADTRQGRATDIA